MAHCHDQPQTSMGSHGQVHMTTHNKKGGMVSLWAGRQSVQRAMGALVVAAELWASMPVAGRG
eukprot:9264542-Pyramimonas_sp.AAC.1